MNNPPPPNRRERRARRSARGQLKAIQGGRPTPEQTPAQRFGQELETFVAHYLRTHSGLDRLNVTKVVMQYAASMAIDHGANLQEYLHASEHVFNEEINARSARG